MRAYLKLNETLAGATSLLSIWHILRSTEFLHWTANLILSHYLRLIWVLQGSRARVCHYSWRTRNGSMKDNRRLDRESIFLQIKVADRFRRCKWSFRFFYLYIQFCAVFSLTKYAMLQTSRAMNKAVAIQSDCAFFYLFQESILLHHVPSIFFVCKFIYIAEVPSGTVATVVGFLPGDFCWYVSFAGSPSLINLMCLGLCLGAVDQPKFWGDSAQLSSPFISDCGVHLGSFLFFVGLCWSCPACILAYCFSRPMGEIWQVCGACATLPLPLAKFIPEDATWTGDIDGFRFPCWRWGCERWQLLSMKGNFFPTPVSLPDRLSNQTTLENDQNEIETSQTEQLPMPDLWLVTKKGSGSDTY